MKNPGSTQMNKFYTKIPFWLEKSENRENFESKWYSLYRIGLGTQINIKAPFTEILLKMVVFRKFLTKNLKPTNEKF